MRREPSQPRPEWRERCEAAGFTFHSQGGVPYWDETARFRFSLAEIERDVEAPTGELLALCYDAAERLVGDAAALQRLAIPEEFWPAVAESWRLRDRDLYGRFDLAYDGRGFAKMLEFNADTPTALLESAVVQWQWLEDLKGSGALPGAADQFNSIHERLIDALGRIGIDKRLHLSALRDNEEDQATIAYLADCALQARIEAIPVAIEDIGVDAGGRFTDLQDRVVRTLFKLYPWEWIAREEFGRHALKRPCSFIEPAWKMVLSNKGLAAELWRLHPGHPNLLPTYYEDEAPHADLGADIVRKPLLGREGANVEIKRAGVVIAATSGPYAGREFGAGRAIIQSYAPVFSDEGRTAILGSWVVAGQACGLCLREEDGPVTTNRARFVPHYILE